MGKNSAHSSCQSFCIASGIAPVHSATTHFLAGIVFTRYPSGADVSGEDLVIGFNSKYLLDVLKSVEDEEVAFELGTSVSSCLIKPVEGKDYTYLVLPVRITVS